MSVWTLVVAALPIPVGYFKLIPSFENSVLYLSVYTSLFCFLSLGFIFFQRHRLGYYMFGAPPATKGGAWAVFLGLRGTTWLEDSSLCFPWLAFS